MGLQDQLMLTVRWQGIQLVLVAKGFSQVEDIDFKETFSLPWAQKL
jgi:hypothetical protein